MDYIHIFISIRFANTEAAAILMYFESPFIYLAFGIELRISISASVNTPRFFIPPLGMNGLFPSTIM
jgi:hypothetical protein